MNARIEFTVARTCKVEVQYLRGRNGARNGFWIVQSCHSEKYDSTSFQGIDQIPDLTRVRDAVLGYNDSTHEGITGKDCSVRKVGGDKDSALFIVTANVKVRADLAPKGGNA